MQNVPNGVVINVNQRKSLGGVHNANSIIRSILVRTTIIEDCTITASVVILHPETYSELGQTGHTPDVHIVTNAFCWKVKGVICKIKGDVSSVRDIYLERERKEPSSETQG